MCFYFVTLFLNDAPQFALHRFECVVDYFGERRMGAVVDPLLVGNQFVSRRDRHIDAHPEPISFLMSAVWLLDGHVAAIDVIAEFFQARRFLHDELIDVVGFRDAAVGDVYR